MPVTLYLSEDVAHYENRQGGIYRWAWCFDNVAVGANVNVYLRTGTTDRAQHFKFSVSAVGVCKVQFFESTRGITLGTPISAMNLNRVTEVAVPTTSRVWHSVTIGGTKGTLLECVVMPGASILGLGGVVIDSPEWHLLPGENYLLEVHNMSAATSDISIAVERIIESEHVHAS